MPTFNIYDDEVHHMRDTIRAYGGHKKYANVPNVSINSYKKQALVELASRLELEEKVRELQHIVDLVHNVVHCYRDYQTDSNWAASQLLKLRNSVRSDELSTSGDEL